MTSYVLYPPTAQWLSGISSLVIHWLEHDADLQTAIGWCDSPVNLKPSISPWNIITKVHVGEGRGGGETLWWGKSWLQFFGTQVVLFTWTALNLRPQPTHSAALQYSNFETMIKDSSEAQEEHIAAK